MRIIINSYKKIIIVCFVVSFKIAIANNIIRIKFDYYQGYLFLLFIYSFVVVIKEQPIEIRSNNNTITNKMNMIFLHGRLQTTQYVADIYLGDNKHERRCDEIRVGGIIIITGILFMMKKNVLESIISQQRPAKDNNQQLLQPLCLSQLNIKASSSGCLSIYQTMHQRGVCNKLARHKRRFFGKHEL